MTRICMNCDRITPDRNLFCTQTDCPQHTHHLFGSGQWVGDLQVVRWVYSTNLAHFYQAKRQSEMYLLKVAHHYDQYEDTNAMQPHYFLVAEAQLLAQIHTQRTRRHDAENPNDPLNMLPVLQPAQAGMAVEQAYYGMTTVGTQVYRYSVFSWIDGSFLTERLAQTPQPYYIHVGQMMRALVSVLSYLYQARGGYAHLNISPDSIFIRTSEDDVLRPVLLDLGFVRLNTPNDMFYPVVGAYANPHYAHPALWEMTKPIINPQQADLYSLGMLTYRLLIGKPVLDDLFLSKTQLRQKMQSLNRQTIKIERPDMGNFASNAQAILQTTMYANPTAQQAPTSVYQLGAILTDYPPLKRIPKEKTLPEIIWKWGLYVAIAVVSVTLFVVMVAQLI